MEKNDYIMITGGLGFIGSHITTWLFEQDYKLIILDTKEQSEYLNYYKSTLNETDLEKFNKNIIIEFFDLNIHNFNIFNKYKISKCIHLASPVGVQNILNSNTSTYDALEINLNIFNYCKRFDIEVIFASSSEVFGEDDHIIDDSDFFIPDGNFNKRGGYAAQKIASEFLFLELPKSKIIRFFNITGVGHESGMFIPKLIDDLYYGNDIEINKKAYRLFSNINDPFIKKNILKAIMNNTLSKREQHTYNIGYSKQMFPLETQMYSDNDLSSLKKLADRMIPYIQNILSTEGINVKPSFVEEVERVYLSEINRRVLSCTNSTTRYETGFKKYEDIILNMIIEIILYRIKIGKYIINKI